MSNFATVLEAKGSDVETSLCCASESRCPSTVTGGRAI